MQIVAVPLYNRDQAVEAYMFRDLKENNLFSTAQATNIFDGASKSVALEMLNLVSLDTFTLGKPLFVPIHDIMLLGGLELQCKEPPEKIIFVFESPPKQEELYLSKIRYLRGLGFRFAVNYHFDAWKEDPVLLECSFAFLSQRPENAGFSENTLEGIGKNYSNLAPIATHIYTADMLKRLYGKSYQLYESRFYRVAITAGQTQVSPIKMNTIRLINIVQDENFDFESVSTIVQGDPALTISLLRLVNTPVYSRSNKIKTIAQAVAMLGQQEVRKWVVTAVSQSLGYDRPNEITRISLARAKFAENLAPLYGMENLSGELFLMGLFSAIDVILELPMPEALKLVLVSDAIRHALVDETGPFAQVLKMVTDYESASWSSVSRYMIIHDIKDEELSKAYIESLLWYKNLVMGDDIPEA